MDLHGVTGLYMQGGADELAVVREALDLCPGHREGGGLHRERRLQQAVLGPQLRWRLEWLPLLGGERRRHVPAGAGLIRRHGASRLTRTVEVDRQRDRDDHGRDDHYRTRHAPRSTHGPTPPPPLDFVASS